MAPVLGIDAGLAFMRRVGSGNMVELLRPYQSVIDALRGHGSTATGEPAPSARVGSSPLALLVTYSIDAMTAAVFGDQNALERHTDEGHPYRLILSLTSAFGEKRAKLVPIGETYDVPELARAMRRHAAARGGPVTLAWVLMSGVNTGPEEARELGRLFAGVRVRLSVIDVNDPTGRFAPAGDAERGGFLSALSANGIGFVRRYSGGPDINAACGMLASRAVGGAAVSS